MPTSLTPWLSPVLTGLIMLGMSQCDGQRQTVAVLQADVTRLKSDVAEVKTDIKTLLNKERP